MNDDMQIVCFRCGRRPEEITEYQILASEINQDGHRQITAAQAVREEEGTFNPVTGHFACTECYIKIGQPSGYGQRWRAP